MNKIRREQLGKIAEVIGDLSIQLDHLMDEEQDYYDNMPESLQGGEKGDNAQVAIDAIQSAIDSLSEASSSVEEAQG